ncbi:hypothetical protein J6590_102095 [Homalodisca vitripennis]|nr:hypothetical protein J6590_102095 [Homalodisca vitripennis]
MQTLVMVLWTTTILLEVKGQEDELWDPWADNCESMVPCNLTEPQTDPMPYVVTLNRPYINSDQAVYVYIRALPPLSFQGFMIQARDDKTGQAVGEFDTDNRKISVINCFGKPDKRCMPPLTSLYTRRAALPASRYRSNRDVPTLYNIEHDFDLSRRV